MLVPLIRFECYFYFRQLSFGLSALCFLVLGMLLPFGGYGGAQVLVNAPFAISVMMSMLSLTILFVITLFSGNGLARDREYRMTELVYSSGLSKPQYMIARFAGLYLSVLGILLIGIIGLLLGSLLVDGDRSGPFSLLYYLRPFFEIIVPNLLFCTSVLFAVGVLTQRITATYITGVLLFVFYLLGSVLGNSPLLANASPTTPEHQFLAILLDPFGLAGVFAESRHWIVAERNSLFIPMQGAMLFNRMLWPAVGIVIISFVYGLFSFSIPINKQKSASSIKAKGKVLSYTPIAVSTLAFRYHLASCWAMARLEIAAVFKQLTFWSFLALWVVYLSVEVSDHLFSGIFGIATFPTTGTILELLIPEKLAILLLIFYCGEIIWSERAAGIHQIKEATPLSNASIYISKLLAVALLIAALVSVSIITALLIQAGHNYYHFEPGIYLSLFYYSGIPLFIFGALFVLVQTLVQNKYLGMLISGILVGVSLFGGSFGLEHPLLRYGNFPELLHSDISGFANKEAAFKWMLVYWSALAGLFLVYGAGVLKRGMEPPAISKASFSSKSLIWLAACTTVVFLASGGYILYQMNVLGNYRSAASQMDWQAAYEQKYKHLNELAQPTITKVHTWVDLYPNERRYTIKGRYQVKNTTPAAIQKLLLHLPQEISINQITVEGFRLENEDRAFGQYLFVSDALLAADGELAVNFNYTVYNRDFDRFNKENSIVPNGSYIELEKMLPRFGYNVSLELTDAKERERRGLAAISSWPPVQQYSQEKYSKVAYETVISIDNDQLPVSVGQLVKRWKMKDRRFYHYKTEEPVPFMFGIAAASYSLLKDQYKDVAIEFYYQKGHEYNIPTMLESVKHTLKYMQENISPYPLSHLRVVEIPHYPGVATAYPGVIFVRESAYLQDFTNPADLNYAYTIAHEVAHQWWGNMLEPAGMQGYKFLTETMAQYIEHAVLEEKWGKQEVARFLNNQQEVYLINRAYADKAELPLLKTENQHYVHYQKGAVVMNGIKELVGEKTLNKALSNFFSKQGAFANKPSSLMLLEELYQVADSSQHALIDFWLSRVFIYDLAIEEASYKQMNNGKYEVKIDCYIEKRVINDMRQEEREPLKETLQVGIYDENNELLLLQSTFVGEKQSQVVCYVHKRPGKVVLDPYVTRLDSNPGDNSFLFK